MCELHTKKADQDTENPAFFVNCVVGPPPNLGATPGGLADGTETLFKQPLGLSAAWRVVKSTFGRPRAHRVSDREHGEPARLSGVRGGRPAMNRQLRRGRHLNFYGAGSLHAHMPRVGCRVAKRRRSRCRGRTPTRTHADAGSLRGGRTRGSMGFRSAREATIQRARDGGSLPFDIDDLRFCFLKDGSGGGLYPRYGGWTGELNVRCNLDWPEYLTDLGVFWVNSHNCAYMKGAGREPGDQSSHPVRGHSRALGGQFAAMAV